jgi:hypothetical protein
MCSRGRIREIVVVLIIAVEAAHFFLPSHARCYWLYRGRKALALGRWKLDFFGGKEIKIESRSSREVEREKTDYSFLD